MKILAVGDLHGRNCWKKINLGEYDRIIFLGDYVDSFNISGHLILENLVELIELKKSQPEKLILLLGNHDIQYSEFPKYRCSGFNNNFQIEYTKLFQSNHHLFKIAVQFGDYLFSHAGLSYGFVKANLKSWTKEIISKSISLADLLNQLHQSGEQKILHTVSSARGGIDRYGGITWADINETSGDLLPGYHQVVGHTRQKMITRFGDNQSSICYVDVLETTEEFFELEIDGEKVTI